jgi:PII-like signaling protein
MEKAGKHERFEGERTLMRIHIGESDRWHGKPLYQAIIELLRRDNFSGATVLRGWAATAHQAFITLTGFCDFRRICRL